MTTTPTSGAADLPEALIHAGMQALLQCTASELENLSPTLFEGYADDVQRVFVAMTGKALSAALSAWQATAAQPGVVYAELPVPNYPKSGGFPGTFTEAQMHAFADRTHALRASHGQAPAETGNSVSARADSVLYDPKAVLEIFNSARNGSDKPVGYMRGILAVIAHWESRPEPHRWMVPARADSVLEDALRYRWLRERSSTMFVNISINGDGAEIAETLDSAVDAARKQGEKQ